MKKAIELGFDRSALRVTSIGLKRIGQQEIRVEVVDPDLLPYAEEFLHYVARHVESSNRKLLSGETFPYGYWMIRFQVDSDDELVVWEYNSAATEFVRGCSLTLIYWRDQHRTCDRFQSSFMPPRPDMLTVIDDGVLEGLPLEGVRYPSPGHMSGWWVTTEKYKGDVSSLRSEHTYHVSAVRPELAPYLALSYGFRFTLGGSDEDAWLDEHVASESG